MTTYENHKRSSAIPVLAGFLLGVGIAVLFTPKSGQQIRSNLNRRAKRAKSAVEETVDKVTEQGKEVLGVAEEAIQEAKQAFEAGRIQAHKPTKDD